MGPLVSIIAVLVFALVSNATPAQPADAMTGVCRAMQDSRADMMTQNMQQLIAEIRRVFPATSRWPKSFALKGTYDEKSINDDFSQLPSAADPAELLRRNRNSLHALREETLVRVFPLFLCAGLSDPRSEIMDHIVYYLDTSARDGVLGSRLQRFSKAQLAAVQAALEFSKIGLASSDGFMANRLDAAITHLSALQEKR